MTSTVSNTNTRCDARSCVAELIAPAGATRSMTDGPFHVWFTAHADYVYECGVHHGTVTVDGNTVSWRPELHVDGAA